MAVMALLWETTAATIVASALLAALEVGTHSGSSGGGSGGARGGDMGKGVVVLHSESVKVEEGRRGGGEREMEMVKVK